MLSEAQIDHYRTYGFLVLRRQLDSETLSALSSEIDRAFRDAFGARFHERPRTGGIEGHYLPVMGPRTPVSRGLVEDPRLLGVAEDLLGSPALPDYAEATLFFGGCGWHTDDGFGVTGAKLAAYLEPLRAGNGALRVLPGSHHRDYGESAWRTVLRGRSENDEQLTAAVERVSGLVLDSEPGDVIVFDLHLFHASVRGKDRRQWTITYYRDPSTPGEAMTYRRRMADSVAPGHGSSGEYDVEAYPFFEPEWLASPERGPFVGRMRKLGVLP